MAIGTPTVGTFTEFSSSSSNAVPCPSVVGAGDCLVLFHTTKLAGTVVTSIDGNAVTGTAPNQTAGPWTVYQFSPNSSGTAPSLCIAVKPNVSGTEDGTTIAVAHTTGVSSAQILAFSGVDHTTPLDTAPSVVDTTPSSMVIPGLTVVTDGAALIAAGAKNISTVTATPPAGFTETGDRVSGTPSCNFSYKLGAPVGATGSQTITWSSGSQVEVGYLAALRPATAAPTETAYILVGGVWTPAQTLIQDGAGGWV
jgi:hypothetical protein